MVADIRDHLSPIRQTRRMMAKRKSTKMTPEEQQAYDARTRRIRERLAEREAVDREEERRQEAGRKTA
jgi:hypothetical protein